ncbi:putative solute-binding protein [Alkanindiges sp. WGS2144]|uniref:putative solute-binding protein n=1 Tax=Alkanindiges sp. WGS2144 TaxID=3366808 RepID=UPI00374FF4D7
MKKIALAMAAASAFTLSNSAQAQTFCVFDLLGAAGDSYALMKDYALAAKGWGANVELKPYTDERVAAEDFKAGKCDGVSLTGMRGRQFNSFTGSIDAIGAIPTAKVAQSVMQLMASPKLSKNMVNGSYEVVGVVPLGAAYLFVNDRSMNTIAKAAGKKVAVLDYDKAQAKMVQQIGAQPVSSDVTNFGSKFNNGQVDIIGAPAIAFKPLELHKGLGSKGAIVRFPVLQVTGNVIIRKDKFPADYSQKSRTWIASQLPRMMSLLNKQEAGIPAKYWMDIPANDKIGYIKLMRESRIALTKEGLYNKSMMSLLKRARCQAEPSSFECALKDE